MKFRQCPAYDSTVHHCMIVRYSTVPAVHWKNLAVQADRYRPVVPLLANISPASPAQLLFRRWSRFYARHTITTLIFADIVNRQRSVGPIFDRC
jgi:hypothetical protein